jgi:hypothetical protein
MLNKILYKASRGKQISVFLDNEPGALSRVCKLLGDNSINMHALTVAEGIDHGYLRIVVDSENDAMALLEANGYMAFYREVLMVEISNAPGAFGFVTDTWSANGININYAYSATGPEIDRALLIVHVNDLDKAIACLQEAE